MSVDDDVAPLIVEQRDRVRWLTLNRPDRMNALSPALIAALDAQLREAEADAATRVLVITGAGRAFCAGADLSPRAPAAAPRLADLMRSSEVFARLEAFPRPVIAAVNGVALAGGLELVLCCDLILAGAGARFGDVHANVGLLPGADGAYRLSRRVLPSLARYLLFTGETLGAAELQAGGLVNRVFPDRELLEGTHELASAIADKSALVTAGMKRMAATAGQPLDAARQTALALNETHLRSGDAREGLAAFAERRAPVFRDR